MVTIKEVAEEAGVSTATVSRVLSNKPHVRAELRERVLAAVDKLEYRPNMAARTLRSQQSSTIGLIVSDIRNPYFTSVSRAVEDTLYEQGLSVFLCNTDENPEKELLYLDVMQAENVAGIIFSPTLQAATHFDELKLDVSTVIIDRTVPSGDWDTVIIDNVASAFQLTEHLIQNGYRHIAALFGKTSTTGRQRRQGYEEALRAHGLSPAAAIYIDAKIEEGYKMAKKMLESETLPDAILTSNSLLTAGALKAIRDLKLTIPDDVALVGFDETTWSALVEPAITVIAQPTYEIGTTAAELLLRRIEEPDRPARQVILKGQLLARGSSAPRQ